MEESPPQHHEIINEPLSQEEFEVMFHWYFVPIISSDSENWTKYPSETNKIIEEAYNQHVDKVDIGEHWISFKDMAQYNNKDNQRSAIVKRQIFRQKKSRLSRFTGELPMIKTLNTLNEPFGSMKQFFTFLRTKASVSDIKNIEVLPNELHDDLTNIEEIAELVIESLKKEAAILGAEAVEGMKMITKPILKSLKSKAQLAFQKAIISIYTYETFLYDQVNKILRNEDWESMDNLLPYIICFFSSICILNPKEIDNKVSWTKLYRGTKLSESMISQYQADKTFSWDAFTSATTNEDVAECFGAAESDTKPVLFTICHWNWMHPEYDNYQQYLENKRFNEDKDEDKQGKHDLNSNFRNKNFAFDIASIIKKYNPNLPIFDRNNNESAPNGQALNQIPFGNIDNISDDEENKSSNSDAEDDVEPKCNAKEDFIYDPYDNLTEYGSLYQWDTKQDYAEQVFSISKYSVSPGENEVIFVPGTIFKVIKTYKKDYMHCIDLKISQRYATKDKGYEQGRFWSLLGLELLKRDIKMKKNTIGLQSLTNLDMEQTVQLLLQGKDFIKSICLDLSRMTEQAMEQFMKCLIKIPKAKVLKLECEYHLLGSICDASRSLGRYLAETSIKELYVTFDKESEAGFFIEQSHNWNLFKNLSILVLDISGFDNEETIEGDQGDKISFQDSIFSKVAESNITELQVVCGSSKLELEPEALLKLGKAKSLEKLTLTGFAISDENVEDFVQCLKQIKISHLSISLSKWITNPNLQELLKNLLNDSSSIQTLCIDFIKDSKVEINDDFVTQIATGIAQSNVQVFDMTMINITTRNLLKLVDLLSQTQLTSLFFEVQFIDENRPQKQIKKGEKSNLGEATKKASGFIPILEYEDLPKKDQLLLLKSLLEIIPKSKLTRFGLTTPFGSLLRSEELRGKLQIMLQLKHIEEIKDQFSHRQFIFAQIPSFFNNVDDIIFGKYSS